MDFLLTEFLGQPAWLWMVFLGLVVALLAFDLLVLHRDDHEIDIGESLLLSAGYVGMGIAFGAWVWWYLGPRSGMEFFTGFLVEKTLAMDNVFVIAMIFTLLAIPREYQHRVLFWGVLGVIVLRAIAIGLGAALLTRYSWLLYIFGGFLLLTGIKMLFFMGKGFDLAGSPLLRVLRKILRLTPTLHGNAFLVRLPAPAHPGGPPSPAGTAPLVWWATPLFLALVLIETVDLVFAVDSVPAIFAITQEPFIVYTSNILAVLGLRALYFALSAMIHRFAYLKYALALVLVFIGTKILLVNEFGKMPASVSLGVTFALLLGGLLYSLVRTREPARPGAAS